MARQVIARTSDVAPGSMIKVEGMDVLVANVDGEYYAVEATCPHGQGNLWEGTLEENVIVCPTHGARFDVYTGALEKPKVNYYGLPYGGPATRDLKKYRVEVDGEEIAILTQ